MPLVPRGVARVVQYATHLANGRADGTAHPEMVRAKGGAAAYHLEPVGAAGLVGLAFGNSPPAMAVAGGRRPLLGTNPIAAVFPRGGAPSVLVDLSLSEAARGKVMVAAEAAGARGRPVACAPRAIAAPGGMTSR